MPIGLAEHDWLDTSLKDGLWVDLAPTRNAMD
jgi:hypothetical protein